MTVNELDMTYDEVMAAFENGEPCMVVPDRETYERFKGVVVHREGDHYWAEVERMPGCYAAAPTLAELVVALGEAMDLWKAEP